MLDSVAPGMYAPSDRKRIIVFSTKGPSIVRGAGGVERGIEHLAPLLQDLGFEFIAYSRARRCSWLHYKGVRYRGTRYIDSKNLAHWTHSLSSVWDYLKHRHPKDVIYVHGIEKALLCPLFALLGHRVIFVLHGQEWRARKWGLFTRGFMRLCRRPMLRFSDVVVTVCKPSLSQLAARYPAYAHKLLYLPNGVPSLLTSGADTSVVERLGLRRNGFFLYSGRLVPQKRIDSILLALASVPSDAPLVIAGSHSNTRDYVKRLESIIAKLGIEDRVKFAGHLSLDQLVGLYSSCRAIVLPSETEGCSQTLLEAVACGCCVVCSDIPENRDVAGNAAVYVGSGNVQGLADAMCEVLDDARMEDYRSRAAIRRNELPGWEEVARVFGELTAEA